MPGLAATSVAGTPEFSRSSPDGAWQGGKDHVLVGAAPVENPNMELEGFSVQTVWPARAGARPSRNTRQVQGFVLSV